MQIRSLDHDLQHCYNLKQPWIPSLGVLYLHAKPFFTPTPNLLFFTRKFYPYNSPIPIKK